MSVSNARARRLRFVSTLLFIAVVAFTIFWSWLLLKGVVPHVFTDGIYDSYYVEEGATVSLAMRFLTGVMWLGVVVLGWIASYFALALLWHVRGGIYFGEPTAIAIKRLGLALIVTMLWDTVIGAYAHSVLTWGNAPRQEGLEGSVGYYPPSYYYDPGDITVFLCGFGFFLLGLLLQEGGRIEAENRGFV